MKRSLLLGAALIGDAAFGDPAWFPHPVRLFGAACTRAERLARGIAGGDPGRELVAGGVLCGAIVGGAYAAAQLALSAVRRFDARVAAALAVTLAWTTLAARDLLAEAHAVIAALDADDITLARTRVARIVGRDTAHLDAAGVARAVVETLAESWCDGIVAPLLALAAGGVPLALAFKAASTLDSMIGHREAPYTYLGRASARLDDVACWIPARIAALALVVCAPLAGGDAGRAFAVLCADGRKHRSPNAGHPEAAMAGALGVCLGGTNRYDGRLHDAECLGAHLAAPSADAARRAVRLVMLASLSFGLALVMMRGAYERWKRT